MSRERRLDLWLKVFSKSIPLLRLNSDKWSYILQTKKQRQSKKSAVQEGHQKDSGGHWCAYLEKQSIQLFKKIEK